MNDSVTYYASAITDVEQIRLRAIAGIDERSASAKEVDLTTSIKHTGKFCAQNTNVYTTTQLLSRTINDGLIRETYSTSALARASTGKTSTDNLGNYLNAVVSIYWIYTYSSDPAAPFLKDYQFMYSTHKYTLTSSISVTKMLNENIVFAPGNLAFDNSTVINSPNSGITYYLNGADDSIYPGGDGHGFAGGTTIYSEEGTLSVTVSYSSTVS